MNNVSGVPSPFYGPKVSKEIIDEVFEFIKKKTGNQGVILIMTTDTVPCQSEKDGKPCDGHICEVYKDGFHSNYVTSALEGIVEEAKKRGK